MTKQDNNLRSSECLCTACGEVFGGERGFDMHRRGDWTKRYCIHPTSLGMIKNSRGTWVREHGMQAPSSAD